MKQIRVTSFLLMIVMSATAMTVFADDDSEVNFDITCFLDCAAGCAADQSIKCLAMCAERCFFPPPTPPPAASPPLASHGMKLSSCKLACSLLKCANTKTNMEKEKCMDNCSKLACENKLH